MGRFSIRFVILHSTDIKVFLWQAEHFKGWRENVASKRTIFLSKGNIAYVIHTAIILTPPNGFLFLAQFESMYCGAQVKSGGKKRKHSEQWRQCVCISQILAVERCMDKLTLEYHMLYEYSSFRRLGNVSGEHGGFTDSVHKSVSI